MKTLASSVSEPSQLKNQENKNLKESKTKEETMLKKSDTTTNQEDHSRVFLEDIHLIEEVEPEETTDQEREEETLETSKMNSTEKNLKNQNKLLQPLQ